MSSLNQQNKEVGEDDNARREKQGNNITDII